MESVYNFVSGLKLGTIAGSTVVGLGFSVLIDSVVHGFKPFNNFYRTNLLSYLSMYNILGHQ